MRPSILGPLLVALLSATAAIAQVNYEPTPRPDTSAAGRDWYRNGDPISFAGNLYYRTGPTIYFNGNTMVPTGSYDGVTLYADTTIEPYSVIFVPVGGNLLRPYERLRAGVRRYTQQPPPGTVEGQRPPGGRGQSVRPWRQPAPPEANVPFEEPRGGLLVETVRKPNDNVGMWIRFQGYRWEERGEAMPLDPARLTRVGEYFGLSVYADARTPYVVYVPLRANLVAPFRRAASE